MAKTRLPGQVGFNESEGDPESLLLGAMILDQHCIGRVAEIVRASHFREAAKRSIYIALLEMRAARTPIELVTLKKHLTAADLEHVGGVEYLVHIVEVVPNTANAVEYAQRVRERPSEDRE